jgi:hypothetical protein
MSVQRNNTESIRRIPIDPKTLVITKAINKRKTKEGPSPESLVIESNISHQQQQSQINTYEYQNHQQNHALPPPPPSRTSYNSSPTHQQPINQNTSGNTKNIVLVCNLDPRATAEDVGVSFLFSCYSDHFTDCFKIGSMQYIRSYFKL